MEEVEEMRVTTEPSTVHSFKVADWAAESAAGVLMALERQLRAASALWPDLVNYEIKRKKGK